MEKLIKYDNYNIHVIENNKFKNSTLKITFFNEYNKEKLAVRNCLLELLFRGNKIYGTGRNISIRTEELYDAYISCDAHRLGNVLMYDLQNKFLNPNYVKEEDYLEQNIKFLFEILFEAEFKQSTLDYIKSCMISENESIKEEPSSYSNLRCNQILDENSPEAVPLIGTNESIEKITLKDVEEEYKSFIDNSSIEISLFINKYDEKVIDLINKYAKFTNNKNYVLNPYRDTIHGHHEVTEQEDFSQSQVVFAYNLNNLTKRERQYTLFMFEEIMGGQGTDTKLNQELREKNSLCYGIYASYSKYDNKLSIRTSVSLENIEKTKELIKKTILDKDSITENDLEIAKKKIIREFEEAENRMAHLINVNLLKDLGYVVDKEEKIKEYSSITLEEVKKVIDKLELNTIYVMEGVSK